MGALKRKKASQKILFGSDGFILLEKMQNSRDNHRTVSQLIQYLISKSEQDAF